MALFVDLRRDVTRLLSARNVVLLGIFAWFLLEPLQLPDALQGYGRAANDFGLMLVGLALWSFLYGYGVSRNRIFEPIGVRLEQLDDRNRLWRVLVLAAWVGFLPVIIYGGTDLVALGQGILGMRRTWGGPLGRGTLGDFRAAFLILETCAWGVSWLAILFFADRRNPPGARFFALFIVAWSMVRAYGSGTRSTLLVAIAVPCAAIFWLAPPRRRTRLVLLAPVFGIAFYLLSTAMVSGRGLGHLALNDWPSYIGHEMFRELLFIVDQVPTVHEYKLGETYWVQLLNPIPRFLWPDKPMGFGVEFSAWHGYDALAGGPNMAPGLIGEMYVNFGILGVVVCSFFGGGLCRAWDRLRERFAHSVPVLMFYTGGLTTLFLLGRSVSMSIFYPLIGLYLTVSVVLRYTRGPARSRSSRGAIPDVPYVAPTGR
jgi:hypothetical protein